MKIDGRLIPHEVLEAHRFAAVRLRKQGIEVSAIAESLGVTKKAVYKWLRRAQREGLRSLRATKASGRPCVLTPDQVRQLKSTLRKPATQAGYATDLWSGPRVRHWLKHHLNIEYHPKHMPRFLHRIGLRLKFPERRALEQDPKEVRRWKKKRLPEILRYARCHRAIVFYADESLLSLIPYVGKTWAFPKAKPIVRVSGRRGQHVGVTAAVSIQGRMCFELTREKERFTARTFLRFVRKLMRENPSRPLVLIVDGAPIHKAKLVKAFEREHKGALRLEILPAYSPEHNPTEKSWNFIKTKKMNGSTEKNKKELRDKAKKVMKQLKSDSDRIISFFVDIKSP